MMSPFWTRPKGGMLLLLLLLVVPAARSDWAGFGRHAAMAEIRLDAGEARISLRIRDTPEAREQLGLSYGRAGAAHGGSALMVHVPGQPDEVISSSARHVAATDSVEAHEEIVWNQRLGASSHQLHIELGKGIPRGAIGLVVLDRGVPVSDLITVSGGLDVLLDAADPWRSHFTDMKLIRRHTEPGSYLYVEPTEVRHELLLRLKDLPPSIWARDTAKGNLSLIDRAGTKAAIGRYLAARVGLKVNGREVKVSTERVEFVVYDQSGMKPVGDMDALKPANALIGAVLVYPTDEVTNSLALTWGLFPEKASERRVSVVLGRETFDNTVTRASPVLEWAREEALEPDATGQADAALEPAQAASLTAENLSGIIEPLLLNTYHAFEIREEEAAYDRMARSLKGRFLEEIYLQQRRSLLKQDRGLGGEGRVDRVTVIEAHSTPDKADGFLSRPGLLKDATELSGGKAVIAGWRAIGEVSHWGHSHKRENSYRARLVLDRSEDGYWRIASMQFLDGHRLDEAVKN